MLTVIGKVPEKGGGDDYRGIFNREKTDVSQKLLNDCEDFL